MSGWVVSKMKNESDSCFFFKMEVAVMHTAKLNGGNPTADSLETQSIKVLCKNSVLSPNELTVVK